MSIKPDRWIKQKALEEGMIEPFEDRLVREGVISFGLSSFGYDLRAAPEWRIFVNAFNTVVDPKDFDTSSLVEYEGDTCIVPPNSFVLTRSVEYLRIPDDTMVVALGKSSYARCFSADTRVALVDGTAPTLAELAERHEEGETFWGYSIGEHGRVVVTLLHAPRWIGRDTLLEITLDDGSVVHATPDHDFMGRLGEWIAAGDLEPGDSLMPLYRSVHRGYEMTYQPLTGSFYPTHRLADEWSVRNGIYEDTPGTHRHHVNHDRRDNRPTNLVRMPASDRIGYHDIEYHGRDFDTVERSAAIREALARRATDLAWRRARDRQQRLRAERFWHDPEYAPRREELLAKRRASDEAGSMRGAARLLGRDRAVFRRFPDVRAAFGGEGQHLNHKVAEVRELKGDHDVYCLTVPEAGNFALEAGVFVRNCGIVANVTPLEPGWEGHVTLELSNTTPLPAKVYANEGIVQLLFFQGERPEVTYRDRKGKYQGQRGVTLPKI